MQRLVCALLSTLLLLGGLIAAACGPVPPAANTNVSGGNANSSQPQSSPDKAPGGEQKASTGSIEIRSTPAGASIMLIPDDEGGAGQPQPRGSTPATLSDVPAGKYVVHIEKPGYKYFQKSVEVKPSQTIKVEARLKK